MDKCNTCRWWEPLNNGKPDGECRGKLPERDTPDDPKHAVWPITNQYDGCRYHNAPPKSQAAGPAPAG